MKMLRLANLVIISTMLFNLEDVESAPIKACKLSREWGDEEYLKNCSDIEFNLTASKFVVSGFSSGGYQTANLLAIFNDKIDAAAINSGSGPCATAGWTCTDQTKPPTKYPTKGLKDMPIFVYSGTNDSVVLHKFTVTTANWLEQQGAKIERVYVDDFNHVLGNSLEENKYNPALSCAIQNPNYSAVHNCGFNTAKMALKHVYGDDLKDRFLDYQSYGDLYAIDQKSYFKPGAAMADWAYLYVPTACQTEACSFQMDFHGCTNTMVVYKDTYMRQLGLLEYAATNNIILLFPQNNDTSTSPYPYCWASSVESDATHPQYQVISDVIAVLFQRDILHLGVEEKFRQRKSKINALADAASYLWGMIYPYHQVGKSLFLSNSDDSTDLRGSQQHDFSML